MYPQLNIAKGSGYYYWYSDNEELSLYLSSLDSTSVYVAKVTQITLSQWKDEASHIMAAFNVADV